MNPDIKDRFAHYLTHEKGGGLSPVTIRFYLYKLEYLYKAHGGELLDLKTYPQIASLIRSIRAKRDWGSSMTKNTADIASVFFNWACREGIIEDSPFRLGHEFKNNDPRQKDFFDWDSADFKKLVYDPNNSVRFNAILHTLRSSGVRASELCSLHLMDYQDRWLEIRNGKGGDSRFAPVDQEAIFWLDLYIPLRNQHYTGPELFLNENLKPLNPHTLWKYIYNRGKKIGVRSYPHKFRKSLGGQLIKNGADLTVAQQVLGHKDISTTANYYVGFKKKTLLDMYDKHLKPIEAQGV